MYNGRTMDTGYKSYECTICYDIFLYPVCLPCNHRFCKSCLDKHIENNTMSCPICRFRVSNWLRQLRRSNADIVDKPFWDTVQKLYPKEVEKRINGHIDYQSILITFWERLAAFDAKEKYRSARVHKAFLDSRYLRDQEDDWLGWPEDVFQVCRNVLQYAKDDTFNQTPPSVIDTPTRRLAKPGEIHNEYKQFVEKELEERRRKDEENFRLSEAIIKMIEDDEKREEEERKQQLLKDEELARRLEEEVAAVDSDRTPDELLLDDTGPPSSCIPDHPPPSPMCLPPSTSTPKDMPRSCSQSPIRLDIQSTSKDNVFAKFWGSSPSTSLSSEKKSNPQTHSKDTKNSSISNKEFSHFAPVHPRPSKVTNGPKSKKKAEVSTTSRCSSGCDSIGQELNHFKPIRSSPTTPPKEGSRGPLPQVVVAQRGMPASHLDILPLSPLDLLAADVTLDELETSVNLEKQLEIDRKLAMEIQNQINEEMKMSRQNDYNLRKRKRPSGNVKKKVLLDRTQTTLDNLLIK